MWLAGGGAKGGTAYGETDEFGFEAVTDKVHLHDLHATILHLIGINHERLTYFHQGRDERLTDVFGMWLQGSDRLISCLFLDGVLSGTRTTASRRPCK
jgi:hypothetical protein